MQENKKKIKAKFHKNSEKQFSKNRKLRITKGCPILQEAQLELDLMLKKLTSEVVINS
jgi:hypothetical protein